MAFCLIGSGELDVKGKLRDFEEEFDNIFTIAGKYHDQPAYTPNLGFICCNIV